MNPESVIGVPFARLISKLTDYGFDISVAALLDIQKIVANLGKEEDVSIGELKYFLSPLVCRNKEEQDRFYEVFDKYIAEEPVPVVAPPVVDDAGKKVRKDRLRKRLLWVSVVTIFLVLVAFGLYNIFLIPPPVPHPVSLTTRYVGLPVVHKPTRLEAALVDTTVGHRYSVDWRVGDSVFKNRRILEKTFDTAGEYMIRTTLSDNGRQALDTMAIYNILCEDPPSVEIEPDNGNTPTRKSYYAHIVNPIKDTAKYRFYWYINDSLLKNHGSGVTVHPGNNLSLPYTVRVVVPCKQLHCSRDTLGDAYQEVLPLSLQTRGQAKQTPEAKRQFLWSHLALWIGLGLIFPALLSYSVFYPLRRRRSLQRGPERRYTGPHRIDFSGKEEGEGSEPAIARLADTLRKRQETDVCQLDIIRTIRQTIRAGGFPFLVFSPRTEPTDFIFMIESQFPDSHLVHLFGYLAGNLRKQQVNLHVYSYNREPLLLTNLALNQVRLPIAKVASLHPGAILFLCTDGESLLSPRSAGLKSWVEDKFRLWGTKFILSPAPMADWSNKESLLAAAGFAMVPADMNAQYLIAETINRLINRELPASKRPVPSYSVKYLRSNDWLEVRRYLGEGIREMSTPGVTYADPGLVSQWLAALSIYPEPHWQLTLAIGKALEEQFSREGKCRPGELVNFANLLLLSRIEWMQTGQWSESLRVTMMEQLDPGVEDVARRVLLSLLGRFELEYKVTADSLVKGRLDLQKTVNRFLLFRRGEKGFTLTREERGKMKEYLRNQVVDYPTDLRYGKMAGSYFHIFSSGKKALFSAMVFLLVAAVSVVLLALSPGAALFSKPRPSVSRFVITWTSAKDRVPITNARVSIGNTDYPVIQARDTFIVSGLPADTLLRGIIQFDVAYSGGVKPISADFLAGFGSYGVLMGPQLPDSRTVIYLTYNDVASYASVADRIDSGLSGYHVEVSRISVSGGSSYFQYYNDGQKAMGDSVARVIGSVLGLKVDLRAGAGGGSPELHLVFAIPQQWTGLTQAQWPAALNEIWGTDIAGDAVNFDLFNKVAYVSEDTGRTFRKAAISGIFRKENFYKLLFSQGNQFDIEIIKGYATDNFFGANCGSAFNPSTLISMNQDSCPAFDHFQLRYDNRPPANRFYLTMGSGMTQTQIDRVKAYLSSHSVPGATYNFKLVFGINRTNMLQSFQAVGGQLSDTVLSRTRLYLLMRTWFDNYFKNVRNERLDTVVVFPGTPFDRNYVDLVEIPAKARAAESLDTNWFLIGRIQLDSNYYLHETNYESLFSEISAQMDNHSQARLRIVGFYDYDGPLDSMYKRAVRATTSVQSYLGKRLGNNAAGRIEVQRKMLLDSVQVQMRDQQQQKLNNANRQQQQQVQQTLPKTNPAPATNSVFSTLLYSYPTYYYVDIYGINMDTARLKKAVGH